MRKSARAYEDKGDAPLPLITSSARHAFIPRGKPRGILQRVLINLTIPVYTSAEVSGDGKIGIGEVIYILQTLSGFSDVRLGTCM
jgi:hypothetical protein